MEYSELKLALILVIIGGSNINKNEEEKHNSKSHREKCHLLIVGEPGSGKSELLHYS